MNTSEAIGEAPGASLDDITVFLVAGGLGLRARPVTGDNDPKTLIDLQGKTVLSRLCGELLDAGFDDLALCTGYLKEKVRDHVESWDLGVQPRIYEEEELLGPERAVLQAVDGHTRPRALIVPGDMVPPGDKLKRMAHRHAERGAHITLAGTSLVTDHTPARHVGRLATKKSTDELVECLDHPIGPEEAPVPGTRNLTSLGAIIVDTTTFVELCKKTLKDDPPEPGEAVDLRDRILALAIKDPDIKIDVFDFEEEVIDLGVPSNIVHAKQQKWE